MQTFLPYPDFRESARVLDDKRLGKQRVEAMQLHRAIVGTTGWSSHPAAVMWRQHPRALARYGLIICVEWISRGFRDSLSDYFWDAQFGDDQPTPVLKLGMPWWLGDDQFHASHRSNLLRKKPDHYGRLGWVETDDLPYVWPGVVSPTDRLGVEVIVDLKAVSP